MTRGMAAMTEYSKTRMRHYQRRQHFKVAAKVRVEDNVTVSEKNGVKFGRPPNPRYSFVHNGVRLIGKRCSVCKVIQPYHNFHKLYRSIDGHNHLCKACKALANANRRKNRG